jgi:TRAP-type mannitol/chloroaromatic compound transport system substrate-binding protein
MDRRSIIKNAGIAGVLAAGQHPQCMHRPLRWRLASSFPKALDTIFGAAEVFAKQVKCHVRWQVRNLRHPAAK